MDISSRPLSHTQTWPNNRWSHSQWLQTQSAHAASWRAQALAARISRTGLSLSSSQAVSFRHANVATTRPLFPTPRPFLSLQLRNSRGPTSGTHPYQARHIIACPRLIHSQFSRMTRPYAIRALSPLCVIPHPDLAFRPSAPPSIAFYALFPSVSIHPIVPSIWSSPAPYLRYHDLPRPSQATISPLFVYLL